jgi:GMP synthase-like glutamine amidotransferase
MRLHYLQHTPFEGPGHISAMAEKLGAELSATCLYAGQKLPLVSSFDLLFILGGPMGVYDDAECSWLGPEKLFVEESLESGKKIIGICLGAQILASVLGAAVYRNSNPEIGWFPVMKTGTATSSRIGKILPETFQSFHWHNDTFDIPIGAIRLAKSIATENQGFVYEERALALQFHLESTRESILQIYENSADEVIKNDFVQASDEALQTDYIRESNSLFEVIVREFIAAY